MKRISASAVSSLFLSGIVGILASAPCRAQGYTITTVPVQNLFQPAGINLDAAGNLYTADPTSHLVLKVSPAGTTTTVAGVFGGGGPYPGDGSPAVGAYLNSPDGVAVDPAGNIYISDTFVIRKVTPQGIISTVTGGIGFPAGLAFDTVGNLYIVDTVVVLKMSPGGTITTVAGTAFAGYSGDGGPATSAMLSNVQGVAVDSTGNIYIADTYNNRIRKVSTNGIISTIAGTGAQGYAGDGGPATGASLNTPYGVAVDAAGSLYIADYGNNRIRKVTPDGLITTIAGDGRLASSGDGGSATAASVEEPIGIVLGPRGTIYVAEIFHVRLLTPSTTPTPTPAPTPSLPPSPPSTPPAAMADTPTSPPAPGSKLKATTSPTLPTPGSPPPPTQDSGPPPTSTGPTYPPRSTASASASMGSLPTCITSPQAN